MTNIRLIDANALKEQFFGDYDGKTYFTNEVLNIIDNAPTVEQKYYERVIAQINPVIEARPQGKWIEKFSDYGVYYRCSICHKMPPNYECDYK